MLPTSFNDLPSNLPIPENDGACDHLLGKTLPDLSLASTSGKLVNLRQQSGLIVLYAYPLTGRPGVALPLGWNDIPGASGCTPESCSFRDHHAEIRQLGAEIFGLSTQSTDYQKEMRDRLHLTFDILSDDAFEFTDGLSLPTFPVVSIRLLRRVTLIISHGVIEHVFYPIFPPDKHPEEVISYLKTRTTSR